LSSLMRIARALLLMTKETVETDTPAFSAISFSDGFFMEFVFWYD